MSKMVAAKRIGALAVGTVFLLMGASSVWGEEASVKAADMAEGYAATPSAYRSSVCPPGACTLPAATPSRYRLPAASPSATAPAGRQSASPQSGDYSVPVAVTPSGAMRPYPRADVTAPLFPEKAAEQGHASSQHDLGPMYAQGQNVAQDDAQAWYRKAADYELGMGLVYTTGQTDWNHDATSASALLGNPTSELTYEELDTLALEFNGRVSLRGLGSGFSKYFVRGNVGFDVDSGDGNLQDDDWLAGQVLFSSTDSEIPGTDLFYLTADVGHEMLTFGEGRGSLALFMGYSYWTEENEGWGLYNRLTGATARTTDVQVFNNKVEWHSFRLGALAEFPLNDRLSLTADVAFIPYADMHNEDSHLLRTVMTDFGPVPNIIMDGSGLGFQGEVGLAYDLTQNWAAALDFRYWNLQGDGDITLGVDSTTPAGPFPLNDFDTFRYGISADLTYGF
jgi:hypothetical protein